MERKIGETFEFESKIYKVIKTLDSDYSCNGCAFKDKFCYHKIINTILGECCNLKRRDRKNVIFEEFKDMETKDNNLDRLTYGDLQISQCNNLRDWNYINECNHHFHFEFTYVHELQHLLFALHIDSNLKI